MITWNTDVNAPCCPGEIVSDDGRTLLVQTDWDYPGTAMTFGWSVRNVQKCPKCDEVHTGIDYHADQFCCDGCDAEEEQAADMLHDCCDHDETDGTVDCPKCGCTASQFITAAGEWLEENDGATADDPGYFR